MASTIFIGVLLAIILLVSMIAMAYKRRAAKIEHEYRTLLAGFTEANALLSAGQSTADNFRDACRLIAIHRNGRLNHFTFARGNEIFMIDTMGLLSDVPDDWRRKAGLQQ